MRTALLLLLSPLLVLPAAAQSRVTADAALETYQLTMPNVRKMAAAYEAVDATFKTNPSLGEKLSSGEEATSAENLVQRLDGEPAIHRAIVAAGITARDLVLTQFALFTAGMTDFAVKAGGKAPTAPAALANLQLYQQNRTEIEGITARLQKLESFKATKGNDE